MPKASISNVEDEKSIVNFQKIKKNKGKKKIYVGPLSKACGKK
jgi:hypothetical protein